MISHTVGPVLFRYSDSTAVTCGQGTDITGPMLLALAFELFLNRWSGPHFLLLTLAHKQGFVGVNVSSINGLFELSVSEISCTRGSEFKPVT